MFKIPKIVPDQYPQKCQRPPVLGLGTSELYLLNIANSLIVLCTREYIARTCCLLEKLRSQDRSLDRAVVLWELDRNAHSCLPPAPIPSPNHLRSESLGGGQCTLFKQALQVILMHVQICKSQL